MRPRAGFVLVGGASSRMGRDKALLPWAGLTLVEHVARQVKDAAGCVTLVGSPERYRDLPFPGIPDLRPGAGPLAGIESALAATDALWNAMVACDMPSITAALLSGLFEEAGRTDADCAVPVAPGGRPQPLCAVYHRRCLAAVSAALDGGIRRMSDALAALRAAFVPFETDAWFANLNRPGDLAQHAASGRESGAT